MNARQFVKGLKHDVAGAVLRDVLENFETPSGKRPSDYFLELSEIFQSFSEAEKTAISKLGSEFIAYSFYKLLSILDGTALEFEEMRDKRIRIVVGDGDDGFCLSDSETDTLSLNELFRSEEI